MTRPTTADELDEILRKYFSRVVSEAIEEHNGTIVEFAERSKIARHEAKAQIEQLLVEARISELGNVQLDYGNMQARVWVDGKLVPILYRLAQLESNLNNKV
jgi:hypothetical protein